MSLKHDAQGFLVGDVLDLRRAQHVLRDIRDDVKGIRRALQQLHVNHSPRHSSGQSGYYKATRPQRTFTVPAVPVRPNRKTPQSVQRNRDASNQLSPTTPLLRKKAEVEAAVVNTEVIAEPAKLQGRGSSSRSTSVSHSYGQQAKRDKSGRFTSSNSENTAEELEKRQILRQLGQRIGDLASAVTGSGMEQADPAIQALHEVTQPLGQGYNLLASVTGQKEDKRQTGWLRRIARTLMVFRKEESEHAAAANRSLKAIENKPIEGKKRVFPMAWRMPGMAIAGLGRTIFGGIAKALKSLLGTGRGLVAGALGKGSSLIRSLFGKNGAVSIVLSKVGGVLLKRLPFLGAFTQGLSRFQSMWDTSSLPPDADSRTKAKHMGRHTGGLVGGVGGLIGGAKLGAMAGAIAGPVGVAIGGLLGGAVGAFLGDTAGDVIGGVVGGWVDDLRQADIPGKITSTWEKTTAAMRQFTETAMTKLSEMGDTLKKDLSSFIKRTTERLGSLLTAGWDALKQVFPGLDGMATKAGDAIHSVWDATSRVVSETLATYAPPMKKAVAVAGEKANQAGEYLSSKVQQWRQGGGQPVQQPSITTGSHAKFKRKKFAFDKIRGGDGLSKYGSYTHEEAQRIHALKASGANTSAHMAGGMPVEIQNKIRTLAQRYGLDPVMMQQIAAMESGGNTNAISSTGAIGIYQFVGKTASAQGITNRFDADQNIEAAMRLTLDNQRILQRAQLPVTTANLYMMHQLGAGRAKEVIRAAQEGRSVASLSKGTQQAMGMNYGAGSTTASAYIAKNAQKLQDSYQRVVIHASKRSEPQRTLAAVQPKSMEMPPAITPITTPVISGGRMPTSPVLPKMQKVVAAPAMPQPLPIRSVQPQSPVRTPEADVGQDVRDRRLAHLVTGGISHW